MKKLASVLSLLLLFLGCREPYDPEIGPQLSPVLVVEGYLDTEGLPSQLKISKTVSIESESTLAPESGARITLYGESGTAYPLPESAPGVYVFENDISEDMNYWVEIELSNGQLFESLPIRPIVTPDILDAGFERDEDGVEVFATTQGNENANDFLWTFEETWIYRARIRTNFIYDEEIGDVRTRSKAENIALCFKTEPNSDILLETSSRFQEQVVFRQTITEIPTGDERIQERYSILISQRAIDSDAVKFWETLKRNTEDIGSIFSPLPSQISGNIQAVGDPQIPVIGQVSMGVTKQRRIYINRIDVSPWNYQDPAFDDCFIGIDPVLKISYASIYKSGAVLPVTPLMAGIVIVGYYPADRRCADCTLYASPVTPDFWEND